KLPGINPPVTEDNDLTLALYTGTEFPLTEILCLDDDESTGGGEAETISLTAGATYYLRIGAKSTTEMADIKTQITPLTKVWNGAVNSSWTEPGNWFENFPAVAGDDVIIEGGQHDLVIEAGEDIALNSLSNIFEANLTLSEGGTITVNSTSNSGVFWSGGKLTISGQLNLTTDLFFGFNPILAEVVVTPTGTISLTGTGVATSGDLTIAGDFIVNDAPDIGIFSLIDTFRIAETGLVSITNATGVGFSATSSLEIDGQLNIDGSGEAGVSHDSDDPLLIGSTGTLTITGSTETALVMEDGRATINNGTVTIDAPNDLTVQGGTFTNATGGKLFANGVIDADLSFASGSTLGPGNSPGCLQLTPSADLSNAIIQIELEGPDQCTAYDYLQFAASGDITDATLELSGDYVPEIGDEFTILEDMTLGTITGNFNGLPQGSEIVFNGAVLSISYEADDFSAAVVLRTVAVLPLDLLSFTGEARDKANLLAWTTANEEDFSHFEVERSSAEAGAQRPDSSADRWEIVGEVLSSADEWSYSFEDDAHTAYYRLKLIDLDGTFSYSEVVYLENFSGGDAGAMTVYPNPSTGRFTVDLSEAGLPANGGGELRLVDLQGREIWSRKVSLDHAIELSHPRTGVYLLTLVADDGRALTRRIIIY
ncbi:MAG: T9SS type A sorting domain-containing protein, partial [Bacteroidota bacterium]